MPAANIDQLLIDSVDGALPGFAGGGAGGVGGVAWAAGAVGTTGAGVVIAGCGRGSCLGSLATVGVAEAGGLPESDGFTATAALASSAGLRDAISGRGRGSGGNTAG